MSNPSAIQPEFDAVSAALTRCRISIDAAELHGLMIGHLTAGEDLPEQDWFARIHVDGDPAAVREDAVLTALREAGMTTLVDPNLGFSLLLPDDDAALTERASALFSWCRGFLAGYSLVPGRTPLSDDAQEAFADLTHIATFLVDEDEQDEQALVEIAEFVRVAVLLIHGDVLISLKRQDRLH